jgi:hypothetical protein
MPFISAIAGAASAAAGAIGATFSAISGFTVAGFGVGKALLNIGLAVGLQAVAGALAPRQQAAKPGAIQSDVQIGGDIPRQVVFGRNAVKGQFVYGHTYEEGNAALQMVYVLSDGWCGPLTRIRVNDATVSIDGGGAPTGGKATGMVSLAPTNGEQQRLGITGFGVGGASPAGGASAAGEPSFQVQYFDGRPGQPANATLVTISNTFAASRPGALAGTDRFAGMAYVVVTLWRAAGNFDAIPELLFEFDGYRCYDPRKDSTAGGSGAHRLNNPATWEVSGNPAVQLYNYITGVRSEGQIFMGVQAPAHDVMTDLFIAAANICDEPVTLDGGGNEPRYRAAHVIAATDSDHRTQMAPLVQAMAGYMIERGGMYGVIAGASQVPVATITDNDIIWDRGVEWSASKSRLSRVNEVYGQFTDPNAGWQGNSYPPERSAGDLAYDGERLAVSFDLAAVQSVTQAQRVARIRRRETRREATATLPLGFAFCWLEAGDWITWNSATFATTRTYRIMSRDLNADDTVTLGLQEVGNEIYSWTAADERPYVPPPTAPAGPPLASTVSGLAVQADTVASRPVVRVTWDPVTDTRVVAVIIEYRPVGSTSATRVRDDSPADGLFVIDQPPTDVPYEYRATIVTVPARISAWTAWVPLATVAPPVISLSQLAADLQLAAQGVFVNAAADAGDLDQLFQSADEQLRVRESHELALQSGLAAARVGEQLTVAITETAALAERLEITEATVGANTASTRELQQSVATQDGAIATLQSSVATVGSTASTALTAASTAEAAATAANTTLNARFGGNAGGALLEMASVVDGTGVRSAVNLRAKASVAASLTDVGFSAFTGTGGSGVELGGSGALIQMRGTRVQLVDASVNSGNPVNMFSVVSGRFRFNPNLELDINTIPEITDVQNNFVGVNNDTAPSWFGTTGNPDNVTIFNPGIGQWFGRKLINSITVTGLSAGSIVQIDASGQFITSYNGNIGQGTIVTLFRNGTMMPGRAYSSPSSLTNFQVMFMDVIPSAGNYTYELWYSGGLTAMSGGPGFDFSRTAANARLLSVRFRK